MKIKFLTLALFIIFLSTPLFARPHIVDNADLLSDEEIAELEEMAQAIAESYKFDLIIVTEYDIGYDLPMDYADDFFDEKGYGIFFDDNGDSLGEERDGCLFLQVTESRDNWFSTSGRCDKILNPVAFNKLESTVVSYLKSDVPDPAGAYRAFIDTWETFLALEAQGRSYNFFYRYNIILVIIAWVLALAAGLIVVLTWKKQMNTALVKEQADNFIIPGSLAFTQQSDRFLYSNVTKIPKPKAPSSSTLSHISSSGRKHGGRGGKY
jgi:uncharacterized protein